MSGYTARDVEEITGASYANVLYWLRTGLISAGESPGRQSRQRHEARFSFNDVLEVSVIVALRKRGAPVKRIRKALNYLKRQGPEFVSLFHLGAALPPELRKGAVYLDVSGDDIHIYRSGREAFSAVRARGQQLLIYALMVDVRRMRAALEDRVSAGAGAGRRP